MLTLSVWPALSKFLFSIHLTSQNIKIWISAFTLIQYVNWISHDVWYHWEGLQSRTFEVHSASNRNGYQGISLGVQRNWCIELTTLPLWLRQMSKEGWKLNVSSRLWVYMTFYRKASPLPYSIQHQQWSKNCRICHKWSTKKYIMCNTYCVWHREGWLVCIWVWGLSGPLHLGLDLNGPFVPNIESWEPHNLTVVSDGPQA